MTRDSSHFPDDRRGAASRGTFASALYGSRSMGSAGNSRCLEALEEVRDHCRRIGEPLTVVMIDCGPHHQPQRDPAATIPRDVPAAIASLIDERGRPRDVFIPLDEHLFLVGLAGAREVDAIAFGDRCRRLLRRRHCGFRSSNGDPCLRIGIVERGDDASETVDQLVRRARIALTQAGRLCANGTATWNAVMEDAASGASRDTDHAAEVDLADWMRGVRRHVRNAQSESTNALVEAVDARDPYTRAHSQMVERYAQAIGVRMGLGDMTIMNLRSAALLHDVGKIGVPDAILTKPGPLTNEEFEVIKKHPEIALRILDPVHRLSEERAMILHHHERFDGRGYPAGLEGDRIPLGARILAAADALDTMFSPRTYKDAYDIDHVRDELVRCTGTQFDPAVVDATLHLLGEA